MRKLTPSTKARWIAALRFHEMVALKVFAEPEDFDLKLLSVQLNRRKSRTAIAQFVERFL